MGFHCFCDCQLTYDDSAFFFGQFVCEIVFSSRRAIWVCFLCWFGIFFRCSHSQSVYFSRYEYFHFLASELSFMFCFDDVLFNVNSIDD